MSIEIQRYKAQALKQFPDEAGVYVLCDLDEVPIYVGRSAKSKDASLRKRVQRHLTSARTDVIANRQIDVWEIAYVWGWRIDDAIERERVEAQLLHYYNDQSPLVNGTIPPRPESFPFDATTKIRVQVMQDSEIKARQDPSLRFPRQIQHFGALVDYILNTQDKPHLRRALRVYFDRLTSYYERFLDLGMSAPTDDDQTTEE